MPVSKIIVSTKLLQGTSEAQGSPRGMMGGRISFSALNRPRN